MLKRYEYEKDNHFSERNWNFDSGLQNYKQFRKEK